MGKAKAKLTPAEKAQRRSHTIKHLKQYSALYAMMILPLLYFIIFKYVPMFGNILAFRRYRPGQGMFGTEWTLRYFERFLKDPAFWRALRNKHLKKVVQTISYMPRFISTVVVIAIMNEILSPSSGLLNNLLHNVFGMTPIYFMNEPGWFRPLYILSESWQYTGWTAIIYLAAITGISSDLYEAAEMDGATRLQQIFHVTIPSIMPTIMVMLIMNVGRMLSIGYEKVLLMYTPSNSGVSDIIDTLVYRTGLQNQNYSYATAIGLFGGIIGLILVSGSNAISKKLTDESLY